MKCLEKEVAELPLALYRTFFYGSLATIVMAKDGLA
jgi:hypothetical protein